MVNELVKGREKGIDGLVLSGGEPTIHPDILKVVSKAKEMGYKEIQIKSNGIKLNRFSFVKDLAEAGVDTFCLSIQGPRAEVHDKLVGFNGAFDSIIKASEYVHNLNKVLITPTCIQKENYKLLPETIELFKSINSNHCTPTFVETNGSVQKYFHDIVPRYSDVIPYLKEAVRLLVEYKIPFNLHGFPMCIIAGYENSSIDLWRNGTNLAGSEIDDYSEYEKDHFRVKHEKCSKCILTSVCNGPWSNYVKEYGFDEFNTVKGESITDIISIHALMSRIFSA
jgi:MoaA/NifB/PqqE/SkfB family radical SAM enzyme